jgi:hypothetical protein
VATLKKDERIGRTPVNAGPTPTPSAKPSALPSIMPSAKPSVTPIPQTTSGTNSNINSTIESKLGSFNIKTVKTSNVDGSLNLESLGPTQITQLGKLLKKMGYSGITSQGASVKAKILTDPVLSQFAAKSSDFTSFYNNLISDYLPGLDTQTAAANYPSRNVYKYQPQDIYDIVNNVYKDILGRDATDQEKQKQYASLKPMIDAGTLSTTSKVKNPKTGKIEVVTTQTPGFSQKAAEAQITKTAKTENAGQFDRKKALDFSSALNNVLSGGM